ncbi:MAG TPA: tRNA (adenosine(37)-N6)-threonylcarbamoyltransferase complex transferase subunit TsaD [Roseiflexaceae bacterium]|nr:tRNA (adenosine(37)-N6)-threonylcarbamoyltransferase complex transferase subunit TsaD [Roseiflexaceae bacterium]HMP42404.1 tRNA (adenosine(37)-N6)-threonylcarbamoyltransferase complex transferase subunit TsaD [Roseiflexaceae bacterium]
MNGSSPPRTILALETSCDETAAAVVRDGRIIVANIVASQIEAHRRYGGVVPEVASRQHILTLDTVVREALALLPGGLDEIDAVAATYGPGLAGALMTGLNMAKAIAWIRDLPLIGVNHIEAHIYANWLIPPQPAAVSEPAFPIVALVVSGGHTLLALLEAHGRLRILGQTRDDAAGEAFDKVARIMGLGFPGGPAIQQAAYNATERRLVLPRAWLRDSYDFSFSGLKTAVLHQMRAAGMTPAGARDAPGTTAAHPLVGELAYAFQESVVDVLVSKACEAAQACAARSIILAGGVAANARLRDELTRRAAVPVHVPPLALCTDNAAMIAAAAFFRYHAGVQQGWALDVDPALQLDAG